MRKDPTLQMIEKNSGKLITPPNIGPGNSTPHKDIDDSDNLHSIGERNADNPNIFADTEFVELESIGDEELFIANETYNGINADNEDESKNLISLMDVIESKESCV